MGVIQIPGGLSGRTYEFTIRGDAPSATETARAQAFIQQEEEAFRQRYAERFGEELDFEDRNAFGRGLDVGTTSAYGALGTAARSAGEGMGIDFLSRLGTGMEGSARMEQIAEAGRMQAPTRFADVENVGDFLTFVGEGAGQTAPEMAATIGAGALGSVAGGIAGGAAAGPLGALAGSGTGFIAGSTAAATPLFFGRNIQRQEQQVAAGALPEVDRMAALRTAGGQALLNSVGDKILATGRLLGIRIPPSQNLFVRVGQYGAAGAVVEVPTEITQQLMERAQAGLPIDSDDAIAEYIEAGILGGVIGAGVGGGLGAFRGPEAPPAPPGATPPAAGPAPTLATPPATPAAPPVPPATPPAPATVVNTRTATVAGRPMLDVSLSDGQRLTLPANATQADIDAAVAQYNTAQKQIIPPAGPSVPPVTAPVVPAVPPVSAAPTPGLTVEETAAVEEEAQEGTPEDQTRALLRSLRVPPKMEMYGRLETLGVGPTDPTVLNELERFIPIYQRNKKLMDVDPEFPARAQAYIDATRAAEAANVQAQPAEPTQSMAAPTGAVAEPIPDQPQPVGAGVGVPDNTPLTDADAFDAAAEAAAQARAAQPRPMGGPVAPAIEPTSGASAQPPALKPIPWARKRFDEATGKAVEETGASPIIDFAGRKIALRDVNGTQVPFYLSSGRAGKVDVPAGKWYPILGIDPDTGWINKGSSADIVNYYGNDALRQAAQDLDATIGDIRNDTSVPSVGATGPHIDLINQGLSPTANQQPDTIEKLNANLQSLLERVSGPQTFEEAAVEQNVPPAASVPLDPAYTEEAAAQVVRFAAIRAGIPQTPELLAEAAEILQSKGGDPVTILSDLYMPFDAPSDPSLVGKDPFGAVEDARSMAAEARKLPPGAQRLAQGQVTPAGVIPPRTPTIAEERAAADAGLTEAERNLAAAFDRAVVAEPDVATVVEPTPEEIAALEAADRTLRTAWEARIASDPAADPLVQDLIYPEGAIADPSTLEDRQMVRGLFLRGKKNKQAQAAETIFGKYPTVVQGLDHIAELRSRDRNLTRIINNKALDKETVIDPENVSDLFGQEMRPLDYGNALDFFESGIDANTGANAGNWVKANLSPEANMYLMARIEALKASEAAIKERTTMYDPVAVADKATDKEVEKTQQAYDDDSYLIATAAAAGISVAELENAIPKSVNIRAGAEPEVVRAAVEKAALKVAEQRKQSKMPELPTDFTATEQELEDARRGLQRPLRVGGWTGLQLAVADKFTLRGEPIVTRKQADERIALMTEGDIAQLREDAAVTKEFLGLFRRFKTVRQAAILDVPIAFMARAALMNNNLQAALMHIARTAADVEVRNITYTIAASIGNTQVQLVDPADPANPLEARMYGAYDPTTDTIFLPNTGEITIQTLLHEAGHAVTAAYIDTYPDSTSVRSFKEMFSAAYTQIMPYMSSVAYREDGATPTPDEVTPLEVKEFITEIKSNMELRNTLRNLTLTDMRLPQKGTLQNALEWIKAAFRKVLRTIARRGPETSALQGADYLIDKIMSPQRAGGEVLFSRGARPGTGVSSLMQIVRPLRNKAMTPSQRQKFADDANEYLNSASTLGSRLLLGFLPPQAVADLAAKLGIPDPYRMLELVQRRDGMFSRAAQTVDVQVQRLTEYYQRNAAEKEAFDTLTTDSSVEGFDPSRDPNTPAVQDRNYTKAWLAYDVLDKDGNILRTERRFFDTPADRDNAIARLNANTPATRTRARKAGDPRPPGELQTLQELKDRFNALSPEGQTMYRQLRDFYEARYDELWNVMQGQLDTVLGADPRTAAEAKQSIYTKLFDKGQIRPYFPLVREGDYWLEFSAFNPATNSTEAVKMSFETDGARQRMIAQLADTPEVQKDVDGVPIINQYMAADMTGQSFRTDALFVKNIADIFDKYNATAPASQRISEEVMNDIAGLIVKAAPEGSMARQLHKRNNTPGYIEDAGVALHNKGYRLANAAARQASALAIRKQAQVYREAIAKNPNRNQQMMLEELVKFGNGALAPVDSPLEQAAQAANRVAYGYTLLGNVSSFIVNLSSMANVIFPQTGGRYGFNKAAAELTRASRLFLSSGTNRIVRRDGVDTEVKALPSIDNYYVMEPDGTYVVRNDIQMDAAKRQRLGRMAPLLELMSERGLLHHSLFYDTLGLQDFAEGRSSVDKAYAFFGAPFHVVERMNRQAAAIANYELELNRLIAENTQAAAPRALADLQTEAANTAVYQTTQMNGGASLNTAPRFTQRGLMRVAMMYKSYGITVTTLLFKTARQIVNNLYGSTPEMKAERDIAMRQMIGHLGTTFVLAGAHGLPMYGLAAFVSNLFKDEEELSFDEAVRLQIGELYYKGPINALTGFEISERVGLSGLLYRANRYNDDPSAEETLVQLLGGPAWSTVSGIGRGLSSMRDGEYWRGFESMLPLMVSNPLRAARFYFEGGVKTRGDNFIYEDLTSSELIGRALGFNSAELVRRQDRSSEMVRIGTRVQEQRTKLVERLFLARRAGDDEAARQAIEDIREFNRTVGTRFPDAVINRENITSSFDRRIDTIQDMVNGVSINPQVRDILMMEYNAIQDGLTRY